MSVSSLADAANACAVVRLDGKARGTAVLIAPDRALTCAHVLAVRHGAGWQVPAAAVSLRFNTQTVEIEPGDIVIPGAEDFAVLKLAPAVFTPSPVALSPSRRPPEAVKVFGFPLADHTREGVWRDYAVSGPTTSGLVQLTFNEAIGSLVGQSGGPVVDAKSRCLVGLLQEGSEAGRFDRYLPIHQLANTWPELKLPWTIAGTAARAFVESQGRDQGSRVAAADLFRGRARALAKLAGWLSVAEDPGRVLVVTGQPGSGKSAVLGRAALQAQNDHPGAGLVFHARQATHATFCEALAEFVGAPAVNDAMELVDSVSRGRSGPLIVLVDALDEASTRLDRHQIASTLKELSHAAGLRVVVATRPLAAGSPFSTEGLIYRLGVSSAVAANLVDLDQAPYRDSSAVHAFARALLIGVNQDAQPVEPRAWAYYREHGQQAARLAHAIAFRADGNFLVAALSATYFADRDSPVDADDPKVLATMPSSVGEALDKYLDSQSDQIRLQVTTLLRALAYAKGSGITDRLWVSFAGAISGHRFEELDIEALRASALADFLLETSLETGIVVTRVFHQALVDQLLPVPRRVDQERAILACVLAGTDGPNGWAEASQYAIQNAAQHGCDAERLPDLLGDLDFVTHASPDRLTSAILTLAPDARPPIAFVFLQAGRRIAKRAPRERAANLSLAAAHLGFPAISSALHNKAGTSMRVEWGQTLGHPHQRLAGHTGPVRSVAIGQLGDQDVIVSAGHDKTVRIWDAAGQPLCDPLTGHTGLVRSVAVGLLGNVDVVASSGDDSTVRVWDAAGQPIGDPLTGHTRPVGAVAIGWLGNQEIVVSGSDDKTVRVWDAAGQPIGDPLTGHTGQVKAVTVGRLGEQDVIVSAGDDNTVRIWDAAGQPIGDPLTGHTRTVRAVKIGRLGEQDVIVSAGDDNTVRFWDAAGQPIGDPLTGHSRPVVSVAIGRLADEDVIVSAGHDTAVRIWDPDGHPIGDPLAGHTDSVSSVALGRLGGRSVIVSASQDKTVRIWDAAGQPIGDPLAGHAYPIWSVATGHLGSREVIVSAGHDAVARIWDAKGRPIGAPIKGHTRPVRSVALGRLGGRDVIVTGGHDKTVRIWDIRGSSIGDPLVGHTDSVWSVAVGQLDDRDVVVSAGYDGTVRMWDAAGHQIGDPLTGHDRSVRSVAIGQLGERDVIVSGGHDATLRIWDAAGQPIGEPLTGHTGQVRSVAVGRLGDQCVIVSGGDDGTVRVWDAVGQQIGEPLVGHTASVGSVGFGRMGSRDVIFSAGDDATVRVWDETGNRVGTAIEFLDTVGGLALAPGRLVVATGVALASLVLE